MRKYASLRASSGTSQTATDLRSATWKNRCLMRTSISARLSGESRPEWKFVASFLTACTGRDRQASAVLERKVRPLWEAAAPSRTHRIASAPSSQIPADIGVWIAAMRETAAAQQVVARLQ